jgi:hypothetical protein
MADDAETLRAKLEAAEARAAQAELALEGPKRAAEAGVPGELQHLFLGSDWTADRMKEWLEESLTPYIEKVSEQTLREARPDVFRSRSAMSVQHAKIPPAPGGHPNGRSG